MPVTRTDRINYYLSIIPESFDARYEKVTKGPARLLYDFPEFETIIAPMKEYVELCRRINASGSPMLTDEETKMLLNTDPVRNATANLQFMVLQKEEEISTNVDSGKYKEYGIASAEDFEIYRHEYDLLLRMLYISKVTTLKDCIQRSQAKDSSSRSL